MQKNSIQMSDSNLCIGTVNNDGLQVCGLAVNLSVYNLCIGTVNLCMGCGLAVSWVFTATMIKLQNQVGNHIQGGSSQACKGETMNVEQGKFLGL